MRHFLLIQLSLVPVSVSEATAAETVVEDDEWGEDDDAGFAESTETDTPIPEPPGPFHVGGTLQTEEAAWLEERTESPLAKARQTADLWVDYKLGGLRARVSGHSEYDLAMAFQDDLWDSATLEEYTSQLLLREAWIAFDRGRSEASLGRSVVAWGEGRVLSLLDVVNPRDLREPGMVDLEDLRLPVTMARVTVNITESAFWPGSHRFEAMVVPESDFGFRSPPLGPFGMFEGLTQEVELPENLSSVPGMDTLLANLNVDYQHKQARFSPEQIGGYLRWTWRGRGLDLGLYAASFLDQQGVIELPELTDLVQAKDSGDPVSIVLDHRRTRLLGQSGVLAAGSLLFRWEVAYRQDFPFNVGELLNTETTLPTLDVRTATADIFGGLGGASWSGLDGLSIDMDLTYHWILSATEAPLFPVDTPNWAVRIAKRLLKERLALDAMVMGWGWQAEHGSLLRTGGNYELTDGVHVNLGLMVYRPGTELGPLLGLSVHDRVFGGLRWDF